jgi:hypothetical protein
MNTLVIIISAVTAFCISAGGSMGVAFIATKGVMPDATVWYAAIAIGLVSAAKDTRSLLKLPPIDTNKN